MVDADKVGQLAQVASNAIEVGGQVIYQNIVAINFLAELIREAIGAGRAS